MKHRTASLEPGWLVGTGAAAWLALVFLAIGAGLPAAAPAVVPIWAAGTVAAGIALYARNATFRAVVDRVDLRWAIAVHVLRAAIGVAFLVEYGRGVLPQLFAERAGWGDITIGLLAVPVALAASRRRLVAVWNVLGLVDLIVAITTAQYLALVVRDPLMAGIRTLPYALLPTVIVPFFVLAHLYIFARLRRRDP